MTLHMVVTADTIGSRIRQAISASGVNPTRIAADLEVSMSTLHRWMKGEAHPTYLQVVQLADMLDKPLDWFTTEAAA